MAAIDEGRAMLVRQLYSEHLDKRLVIEEENRTLWIVYRFNANILNIHEVRVIRIDKLFDEARLIVNRWQKEHQRYDVFCWYESETRPFDVEVARDLLPNLILGRRILNPRNEHDYEVAAEAFGKMISRREISQLMVRADDNHMSLAKMLVYRSIHGWYYCDMLMTRLWCSELEVFFVDFEFLRECMLCGVRFSDPMKRKITVNVKIGVDFTGVDLIYRDEVDHVNSFTDLIEMESRNAGVVMELGHPVSWMISGRTAQADELVVVRVYRFGHRTLRNSILGITGEEVDVHRQIFLHGLRAYQDIKSDINVNCRLLNILVMFDADCINQGRMSEVHLSYVNFYNWLNSYLVPSLHQIILYRQACQQHFLEGLMM